MSEKHHIDESNRSNQHAAVFRNLRRMFQDEKHEQIQQNANYHRVSKHCQSALHFLYIVWCEIILIPVLRNYIYELTT